MKKVINAVALLILLCTFNYAWAVDPSFDSSNNPSDNELKILRITPEGNDVPAGQQVVFQFDRPVAPIGRMERDSKDIPVTIRPKLNCEWRWLNTSALACQLREEDKMKQATQYEVIIKPGIKTETGAVLKDEVTHSFITARPKVTYTQFVNWLSPGTPLIQVSFNQPVTKTSVEKSLTMTAREVKDSAAVGVVVYPDDMQREQPWWMMITNEDDNADDHSMVNDKLTNKDGEQARSVWVVEPKKELPLNSTIWFDVNPGLVSSEGGESGIENRTIVSFETYPEFKFIGLRCTPKGERLAEDIALETLIQSKEDQSFIKKCAPLSPVALLFSSPVKNSMVKNHVDFSPRLDGGRKDYDPWENTHDWTHLSSPHRTGRNYQVWLPELLKAYQKYTVKIDIKNIKDEFGRKLKNKADFDFFTDHREPNIKLNHDYAVLEKGVESDVPLYVTNLNKVIVTYNKLGDTSKGKDLTAEIAVRKVEDISYAIPLGVKKLIGDDTGILFGRVHPDPKPPVWYGDPQILAQVTPYQVHFKAGHFNSLVWVTTFESGKPVKGARVTLHKGSYENLSELENLKISATTNVNGLAELPGLAEIDPDLKIIYGGWRADRPCFFVKIEHKGDIAVLPLNSPFSITGSDVYPRLQRQGGHTHAWGTTAQGIYKLGDTIQFIIYVREQSNKKWVSPKKEGYQLQVFDPQNKIIYEIKDVILNEFGSFDGDFKVPEQGAVGWYQFKLMPVKGQEENYNSYAWSPMSVLVSDFTPAPFNVKTELNGELFKANDQVEITTIATLHSGGPFTEAEVRLTAKLNQEPFITDNPVASGFTFGSSSGKYLDTEQSNLLDIRGKLDDYGQYIEAFTLPETDIYYGSVVVESAVKDERGKFVASSTKANYAGRNRFVGLRNTSWLYERDKPAKLEALVVNQSGKLVPGVDISIAINHREYKASRVKGPGNAYLTQNIMEWVEETSCSLKSDKGASICEFVPKHPGYYQFVATIKDEKNREHKTVIDAWVIGKGSVVWDQTNDATLQIIPEQTKYKIGDTARYLIKNPFPGAKALVTIERYGILDSWIETLETSTPVIKVPIKPDYLPGFYLSVVAISPRVDKPLGPDKVDLGKPSYRMGYVSAKVADPYKEIEINVSTDKNTYKPREKVKAKIQINKKKLKSNERFEIAVAVVDESVLALNRSGDNYYDPYAGFNRLDDLDVNNYSLISRLVGRQKFEKKGANSGGGGGGETAYSELRNMFKFVSYWNPSIKPDSNGMATIEFEVPDNLTGWRILALAVTKDDRMGLGDANIKVNRPTEIRPVMPNQVIEGDEFKAGFNVMNRTDKLRNLKVNISVDGPLAKGSKKAFVYDIKIAPYKRENIWLPILTKGNGNLKFIVRAGDKLDADALEHSVPVNKRRSLETASTYGTIVSDGVSESVKVPEGIYTDVGSIGAVLSASVIGNLDGAFKYIKEYPYDCWEQRLTKAVVANS
ncbi:MAG: large extracellular alpha-helical protein, partial [Desulfobacterium sp.]|nr:large extracellular alpha-helical protein [Desulfobacterium sp.]